MLNYILKRLLLIIPTLLGIMLLNFMIVQFAPGGPVEQAIWQLTGHGHHGNHATERFSGAGGHDNLGGSKPIASSKLNSEFISKYRGAQGLDPEIIAEIEKMYGFDKPAYERFFDMMVGYFTFDFGDSFFRGQSVAELVIDKMPVSISLGLWTTLIVYLVSIPLGIRKAVKNGSKFDIWTSAVVIIGDAIPSFLFAILLIILFAGGSFFSIFPLKGLISDGWEDLSWPMKILDYLWHMALPVTAMVISGFASLTLLCKNSFLEEISKQYVTTARAKGCGKKRVLYGHVFRNAMLIVIAGFPDALLKILFTGALLIEVIFSLDGLGLLGFESAINRDYPVVFGTLFFFTLIGLLFAIIRDVTYVLVDPRIDFERREA